jgi:hypothetical protein
MAEGTGDSRRMPEGKKRAAGLAIALALATLVLAACGSSGSGGDTTAVKTPTVPAATADHLAKLSNTVASDLDSGATCDAAYAADQLQAAIEEANLPASMRSSVEDAAGRLVDDVNCPPPPTTTEEDKGPKPEKPNPKPDEGDHHDEGHGNPKPHGQDGKLPPGQAKLKGGD